MRSNQPQVILSSVILLLTLSAVACYAILTGTLIYSPAEEVFTGSSTGNFSDNLSPRSLVPSGGGKLEARPVSVQVLKDDTADIAYTYPVFTGLGSAPVEQKINDDLRVRMEAAAEQARASVGNACPQGATPDALGWECHFGYASDYKSFSQYPGRILSVRVETYEYAGGAHGGTLVEFWNYDLVTGKRRDWRDAFRADADYLELIAAGARPELEEQLLGESGMTDTEWIEEGSAPGADNYAGDCVGFTEEGLQVVYQEYQVAPYAQGAVMVSVPYAGMAYALKPDGFLGAEARTEFTDI